MPGFDEAFAPVEAHYRDQVQSATFGHLAPKKGTKYKGYIVFTCGDFGDITCIRCNFRNLPSSPWFFQHLNDFMWDNAGAKGARGSLYVFRGTYEMTEEDASEYEFVGTVKKITMKMLDIP